jgi:hypothetical protein
MDGSARIQVIPAKLLATIDDRTTGGAEHMERRSFLTLAIGIAAGAALATSANAAPFSPQPLIQHGRLPELNQDVHSAVTSSEEVNRLKPEEVRWGHHWHRGWHRRHWGWHHRHWGWHRRWHRHHWRRW